MIPNKKAQTSRLKTFPTLVLALSVCLLSARASLFCPQGLFGQQRQIVWTQQETAIVKQIQALRQLPDETRGHVTKQLALEIRQLPASMNKLRLASGLATLSTEGDPGGRETLQTVTTTLADALREHPLPPGGRLNAMPYTVLANLVHYEHMEASLDSPQFAAAMTRLNKQDARRQHADFTLTDLHGKKWTLKGLHGKTVLVNFWSTWCPPCRKETPDLEKLYERFKEQGLVILGISEEPMSKVEPFAREYGITYPLLLDPRREVNKAFSVVGIPMSFLYNAAGKLVAEAIDMRTQKQFLQMLAKAGIQ